jgi:hypothetical protein
MKSLFLNFQKFYDKEIAEDIASHLEANHIQVELEDSEKYFDVTFANNRLLKPYWLKVKSVDMMRAEDTLHTYYQNKLELVPPDYYLFRFNDDQLMEIVRSPDEWGFLDYPLAIRILENRGFFFSRDEIKNINNDRLKANSMPPDSPTSYIWLSYLTSIFWPAGLITGGIMGFMKKTIYNGDRVYAYSEKDRKHGVRILILSALCFLLWAIRVFL